MVINRSQVRSSDKWLPEEELNAFLRERHAKLCGKSETARAIDYSFRRCEVFRRFVDDVGSA